jgi:hypothetical protein
MKCWISLVTIGAAVEALAAQDRPVTWITRLGSDTVAFERYSRTALRLEGDYVVVSPRTRINHYVVEFNPNGTVKRYQWRSRPAVEGPGVPGLATAVMDFGPDGVVAVVTRAGKTDTTRIAASPAVLPNAIYSWALYGLAVERAARAGGPVTVEQVAVGARAASKTTITRQGDSLAIDFFGSPMMAVADQNGRLMAVNGARTTLKILAEPAPGLDLDRLAEAFAARDRAGQSMGLASPRDTVTATVAGAELWVDYGRPSKRGRQIWGTVVPYDEVWRTGANAATQFRTNKPLDIGGVLIPAGTYTLWTLPTTHGIKLIVNRQTGQWGTEYQPADDLARVDLEVEKLDQPVERFTISATQVGSGGELRFEWDRTRWVARFKSKS